MDKNLEDSDFFDKAMRLLSNDMRDIVFLKIYWRVKFKDIADKRNSTIDIVKKKYYKALRILRDILLSPPPKIMKKMIKIRHVFAFKLSIV